MKKSLILISTILLISCSQKEQPNNGMVPPTTYKSTENTEVAANEVSMEDDNAEMKSEGEPTSNIDLNRMLIRSGDLKFRTNDIEKTKEIVKQLIAKNGGILASENNTNFDYRKEYNLQIKVPQAKFEELFNALSKVESKLETSNITSDDVTDEFVDISARIKTKKSLEIRYQQILNSAKNVKEMMEVERELNNVRAEIESIQSRINSISKQVTYSVINLNFYQENSTNLSSDGFFARIFNSFKGGFTLIGDLLVGLVNIWPILLIIFGVIIWWKKK
jgi:DNA-binding FrmR family transcriptional regulator